MKWFYNMKISVKLLAGFIFVALIAGAIGVMGVININTVHKLDEAMYKKMTVPLGELLIMAESYQRMQGNIKDIILSSTASEYEEYENSIKLYNEEFSKNVDLFSETLLTDEGEQLIKKLREEKVKFDAASQKAIELAKQGLDQEAVNYLRGDIEVITREIETTMERVKEIKMDAAAKAYEDNSATANASTTSTMVLLAAGMLLAVALGIVISFSISKPVNKLMVVAEKISDGNLDVEVDIYTKDEIGMLANAFRNMSDKLNEVMGNISTAAEQVAAGAKQVSDSSMALSQGATEQATSVEQLTASLEEIASQTNQNADSANEANELAENAKSNAVQGNAQMKEMLRSMDEINDSSSNISKIIKVIDEIAFQTNILALNAAVEAARAGQHGKGFAVVAEEVRNLAARSANAAKETTAMIEGSIKKVEGGTKIANETATALNRIVDGITKVANLVGSIAVASNEQAAGIAQINQGIMQVSQVVQTNSATSQESAAASEELSSQAELMKEQVSKFTLRKANYTGSSYKGMGELRPEILRMLEGMNLKKRADSEKDAFAEASAANMGKIALSDREFGKY